MGILMSLITVNGFSQFLDITQVVLAGANDAEALLESYVAPFGKAIGADLGSGWYNTAKPHKKLGFDLTFTASIATVPVADESFLINDAGFTTLTSTATESPTIAGEKGTDGAPLNLGPFPLSSPPGAGLNKIPMLNINLAIGLIKNTEIIVRYFPTVEISVAGNDYGKLGLWGVGVKHDILQWLPIVDKIPIDASILFGYTSFSSEILIPKDYAITPTSYETNQISIIDNTTYAYDDQKLNFGINSINVSLLLSKKLLIFTPYIGVGMIKSNVNLDLMGHYPIPGGIAPPNLVVNDSDVQVDPFSIEVPNTMMHFAAGLRIKLAVITLHGQYTVGEYSMITGGFGICVR